MPTEKQKKAVDKIVENHGNVSKSMREVGYSPNSAKNPKILTDSKGYKEASFDVVQAMKKERARALSLMGEKAAKAKYPDLTASVDKMTKNIELLTGGDTERIAMYEIKKGTNNLASTSETARDSK